MRLTFLFLLVCVVFPASSQVAGDYRSVSPGDWSNAGIWEIFNGSSWDPASSPPSSANNVITVQSGHAISISGGADVAVDQLVLLGNLTVFAGSSLSVVDGAGDDITIANGTSTLYISGTLNRGNLSTVANTFTSSNIVFGAGGVYNHNYTSTIGDLFPSTWHVSSTLFLTTLNNTTTTVANTSWNQVFGNFVYNCPSQGAFVDFDGNVQVIKGDLSILSTNNNPLLISSGGTDALTVGDQVSPAGGDVIVSGNSRVAFSTTGVFEMTVYGDFSFTAPHTMGSFFATTGTSTVHAFGDFYMNATANGKLRLASTGTTGNTTLNLYGDFSVVSGRLEEIGSNPTRGVLNFVANGAQSFVNTGIIAGYINYNVAATSVLDLSVHPMTGVNPSTVVVDGTIIVGSPEPAGAIAASTTTGNIRVPVNNRTFNSGATIIYGGSQLQSMGTGHPATAAGVTTVIDNPAGVQLVADISTTNILRLEEGTLFLNDFRLTSTGSLQTINGNFGGSDLSELVIAGTGDGNWGTLNFLPAAASLNLLQINRQGTNAQATVGDFVSLNTLYLTRGAIQNNGTLQMTDSAIVWRYPEGSLQGNALTPVSRYNITYRTLTPSGGPFANFSPGLEMPSNTDDLESLMIYTAQTGDVFALDRDVWVNGTFNLGRGFLNQGAFDITMRGVNWYDHSGVLVPGAGAVIFDADSTQVTGVADPLFGNLQITATSKVQFGRNFAVQGNISIDPAAEIGMTNYTMLLSGATAQTISAGGATFSNISIGKSSGQGVVLTSDLSLTGVLQFTSPSQNVNLQSNGFLTLRSTSDSGATGTTASIYRLLSGNQVSGTVHVERYMSGEGRIYRYISSPVATATVAQLKDDFLVQGNFVDPSPTQVICGVTARSTTSTLFWYDETVAGQLSQGYTPYPSPGTTTAASPLVVGRGYAAFIRQCDPDTVTLSGTINQGNFTLPVTYTVSDPGGDGWNLVGNPYPCAVDWDYGSWVKTRISPQIAVTDNGSGMTLYYEAGVTNDLPNGQIASGQGFWVRATAANPTLTIRESVKVTGPAEFFRERGFTVPSLMISLSDGKDTDKAYIKTVANASEQFDTLDAPKIFNHNFSLSTLSADRKPLAINALRGFECESGLELRMDATAPGNYSIALDSRGFFDHLDFVLVDRFTGQEVKITDATYGFAITKDSASFAANRFTVKINSMTPVLDFQVEGPQNACGTESFVSLSSSQKGALYSLRDELGNQISDEVAGTGAAIEIALPMTRLNDGANALVLSAHSGCASRMVSVPVTIRKPTLAFNLSQEFSCEKGTSILKAAGAPNTSFLWYENATSNQVVFKGNEFETPELLKDKTYYVSAFDEESGCLSERQSMRTSIVRFDREPGILAEGEMLSSNFDEGNQWYFNGEIINGATGRELAASRRGEYSLAVNIGGCVKTASYFFEGEEIPGIRVFPNPFADVLNVEQPDRDVETIDLASSVGQEVMSVYRKGQKFQSKINLSSIPDGLYLLIVTKGDKKYSYRIIKRSK